MEEWSLWNVNTHIFKFSQNSSALKRLTTQTRHIVAEPDGADRGEAIVERRGVIPLLGDGEQGCW